MKSILFLGTLLVITNTGLANTGDQCVRRWSSMVNTFNGAVTNQKNGFSIIGTNPDRAFQFLNSAHSTFKTCKGTPMV